MLHAGRGLLALESARANYPAQGTCKGLTGGHYSVASCERRVSVAVGVGPAYGAACWVRERVGAGAEE